MLSALLYSEARHILGYGALIALFLMIERWRPLEQQPRRALAFNISIGLWTYLGISLFLYVAIELRDHLASVRHAWLGLPDLMADGLTPLDLVLRFAVYVLVIDFIQYWWHRGLYLIPLLWRVHRLHHSERHLNATTTVRNHGLELVIGSFFTPMIATLLFGLYTMPAIPVLIYTGITFFTHANVRLSFGVFTPAIAGPQLHRLHHSLLPQHIDRNFAQFFPLWDILFGTYCAPGRDEFPATGLADEQIDSHWRAHLGPFLTAPARPGLAAGAGPEVGALRAPR